MRPRSPGGNAPFGWQDGVAGFLLAVVHRFDTRTVGAGALIVLVLTALAGYGLVTIVWNASWPTRQSRLFHAGFTLTCIFFAVIVADEAVYRGVPPWLAYAVAVVGASVFGALVGWHVRQAFGLQYGPSGRILGGNAAFALVRRADMAIMCALVGGLATFAHVKRTTALVARRRQHAAETARAEAQRRTTESRLQALQARVEPMFLFDTLRRIQQLFRSDPAAAGATLEDLIAYLRAALPHLRESTSTAEQEVELARAWLGIMARSIPIDSLCVVDPAALHARLPALIVLPLVQQATSDGTGTLRISVAIKAVADRLQLEVCSTNGAFAGVSNDTPLLLQIADRLQAIHGDRARLECRRIGEVGGSVAVVELPLESGPEGPAAARDPAT